MKNVAKVAVSIPATTLKSLERARVRLRKTRSAVVTEAIEQWLRSDIGSDDRKYVEGYLKQPERLGGTTETAAAVVETWEPWK